MSTQESQAFLLIWIAFSLIMFTAILLFIVWGLKNAQFEKQNKARYLPLEAKIKKGIENA
jgi:cbb3-type cytochrome oxidase maturation protein